MQLKLNYYKEGQHGYYNNESSMHPIFIAQGPAFKKNYKTNSFYNVDIYPLMCSILEVKPAPNNGSITNVESMLVVKSRKYTPSNLNLKQFFLKFNTNYAFLMKSLYSFIIDTSALSHDKCISLNYNK